MMMNKHLIERFKKGKVAINLETKREWKEFMQWLEENTDLRWNTGHKPTEKNYWNVDKEWTCVDSNMAWDAYNIYEGSGLKIIKYKDLKEGKGMKTTEFIKRAKEYAFVEEEYIENMQEIHTVATPIDKLTAEDILSKPLRPKNVTRHLEIVLKLNEIYQDKNMKYGDSFSDTVKEYGNVAALTRMADKFKRIEQFSLHGYEDSEESLKDSLKDIANYAVMYLMILEEE